MATCSPVNNLLADGLHEVKAMSLAGRFPYKVTALIASFD